MNEVVAIVVTYNRKELLLECIGKLKKQTYPLDILIVDNNSTDGTKELLKNTEAGIHYYNTEQNIGGAGGFNLGIKKAVELGYKYLWLMDDDTMPTENALSMFIEKDKKLEGKYGFLSSKVLWKDNSICNMNIQKQTKWKKIKNFDLEQQLQYASFVSLFFRRDIVYKVGLPYKEFFIWADDWEYTRRISKENKCYYIPSSIVHHWCINNMGANIINVEDERLNRFRYMYRNDVVLYRQDGFEGKIYLLLRNIFHKIGIICLAKNKKEKLNIIFEATKEGRRFHPIAEFPKKK